jgi:hypothetical protein
MRRSSVLISVENTGEPIAPTPEYGVYGALNAFRIGAPRNMPLQLCPNVSHDLTEESLCRK